ncbi:MAG: PHP domain-containing protein [Gemmatimonadales bacterium]|nr:PHP domain-containing protein [Gemmatimonadales bacterium]
MGKADLHIHTDQGDGLDSFASILDHVEANTDLDVIAITEHDDITVALRARELWARRGYGFDFVVGEEVTTLEGHLVALFVEEPIPSLRRVWETVDAVHEQGGVCFIPHPMSWLTRSIGPGTLERMRLRSSDGLWFDGIELANPSPLARAFRAKARRLNERYKLPEVGASDAHFVQAIASAHTEFAGHTAADLRAAFAAGGLAAREQRFPRLRDVGLARAFSLPIVGLRATPRQLGWRRTAWSFVSRYLP